MDEITNVLQMYPELIYCVGIMLVTWLVLSFAVKGHPDTRTARLVCLGAGIVLAIPAGIWLHPNWWYMALGYLAAPALYDFSVKWVMKKLGYNYGGKIDDPLKDIK